MVELSDEMERIAKTRAAMAAIGLLVGFGAAGVAGAEGLYDHLEFRLRDRPPAAPSLYTLSAFSRPVRAWRAAARGAAEAAADFAIADSASWAPGVGAVPAGVLVRRLDFMMGIRRHELTRLGCAAQGVEMGTTLGMWVGALGNMLGFWDEKTSWYMAGAASAAGALWGSTTGAADPRFRMRYSIDP